MHLWHTVCAQCAVPVFWTCEGVLWGFPCAGSPGLFYGAGQLHSKLHDNELVQTDPLCLRFGSKRRVQGFWNTHNKFAAVLLTRRPHGRLWEIVDQFVELAAFCRPGKCRAVSLGG